MSSTVASGTIDAFAAVRDAVVLVCEVDPGGLTQTTRLDDVGADSLSRVSIADVVEAAVAASTGRVVHIDDTTLGAATTLADLVESVRRAT
jgi:acyl carrier protein